MFFALIGCKKRENKNEELGNSYEIGIQNCIKVKKDNPKDFFATTNCLIGSRLPNFKTQTIDGKIIDDQMLKGKVCVINFWFTTCRPCVAEIPGFNEIVKKYGTEKVNFISVGRNKKTEIEKFLKKHPWDFSHIANEDGIIEKKFKIQFGYPTTYIVNKNGVIIKSFSGGAIGEQATNMIKEKIIPVLEKEI
ncbi:TlpA disulfide reductase family protein [uncultured Aquimarina sp.]|uniref:TlpA family protein disulfide reductase n=1 Tax=uncultured Aquimarina sp. TaxID=575652 RepID=UPI00260D8B34|nr:TlpA disulfide reductase family protein [uncultured Aquimarina sp.]